MDLPIATPDPVNKPRAALADLLALLVKADRDGKITYAIHAEGMDGAFREAMTDAMEVLGEAGQADITRRYGLALDELPKPDRLPSKADHLYPFEMGTINMGRRGLSNERVTAVFDWVHKVACYSSQERAEDYLLNVTFPFEGIPPELQAPIQAARQAGYKFLSVHNG